MKTIYVDNYSYEENGIEYTKNGLKKFSIFNSNKPSVNISSLNTEVSYDVTDYTIKNIKRENNIVEIIHNDHWFIKENIYLLKCKNNNEAIILEDFLNKIISHF